MAARRAISTGGLDLHGYDEHPMSQDEKYMTMMNAERKFLIFPVAGGEGNPYRDWSLERAR